MTKEEALQQIEEYKKPLDRSTATFGNIVDDYYTTSEVLEITRNQIVSSLRNKGLPLAESAKLSEVPPEILKLPTLTEKLKIVPPNPGAIIDMFDSEFNVTKINAQYSLGEEVRNNSFSYDHKGVVFTKNFWVLFGNSSSITIAPLGDNNVKTAGIGSFNHIGMCSSNADDDIFYAIADSDTANKPYLRTISINPDATFTPIKVEQLDDISYLHACFCFDGVLYLFYKSVKSGKNVLSKFDLSTSTLTEGLVFDHAPLNITSDGEYFYYAFDAVGFDLVSIESFTKTFIRSSANSGFNYVIPFNDLLFVNDYNGQVSLYSKPKNGSVTWLDNLYSKIGLTFASVVVDNEHVICTKKSSPYSVMFKVVYDPSTLSTSVTLVFSFNDPRTTTGTLIPYVCPYPNGKLFYYANNLRTLLIQGVKVDYEFDLERRV